jgi:hypothetical protein
MFVKIFFILLCMAIGAAITYFIARTHTIECFRDRSGAVGATIIHAGINYRKKERIPAGELLRAELEAGFSQDSDGSSSTFYRVRLITLQYTTYLTQTGSSNYANATRKINEINYFIQESTQQSMSITEDNRIPGYIFGGAFGVLAPFIILLSPMRG